MTPIFFLVVLAVAIIFLMLLIMKVKMHPVLALFFTSLGLGLALNNGIIGSVNLINAGFGGTLKGIGVTIILGSILAMGIQDTGAATAISNFFIRLFRGRALELAPALTAFIVSIPVFGDITMVLTAPIASILSVRKKISMSSMSAFISMGLGLTHGLVPPTPGILAIALMYGADLGLTIFWGTTISAIAFFGTWLILRGWAAKEWIAPREDFVEGFEPAKSDKIEDIVIHEPGLPNAFFSMLPILIPVVLITFASFAKVYMKDSGTSLTFFTSVGDRVIALLLGVVFTIILGFIKSEKVKAHHFRTTGNNDKSLKELIFGTWVGRGLMVALLPLLITAMGGAMGGILKAAPVIKELGVIVAGTSLLPILIPFFTASIIMTAVGSMTTAGLTAAAIVLPMMDSLGLSPVAATLSIGCGTMIFSHLNDSGFWIMTQFFNLNTKQGLKYLTLPRAIGGVIGIISLATFVSMGLI
ncbi:GntP family permease [Desulfovibrio gilichinskyi]|uniref:Gluconate:H+ symporter, GntP family n=1 Tax=Desulfovibrio gilichinskyi TaxID=1519643 RepID=A0A1X7EKP6_9BACT|nr:SLC13 family permease [Desulfovibrio gilichinskyi]SMF35214.1 gluconate:H+ symporter, GntP family [Desulfovibrio gilichinskyi]